MRPASVSGYRSFLQKHFYYQTHINANKLPDLYLVILSQPVLEIHMISCYPAAPQGRKRKGANCAARVCGGSWELGEILLPSCSFSDCCHFLPLPVFACPFLYLILSCLARFLPCTSCPLFVPACWDCLQLPPASFSCLTL